jgi:hypothetical protein
MKNASSLLKKNFMILFDHKIINNNNNNNDNNNNYSNWITGPIPSLIMLKHTYKLFVRILSVCRLSYDRFAASSKSSSPKCAI